MRIPPIVSRLLGVSLILLAGCGSPPSSDPPLSSDPLTQGYADDICSSCAGWNVPHAPFQVFGNTYYVGTEGLASILITSPTGHVLIDGGLPDSAPLIEENIGALGFDIADVEIILNSHAHFDHSGGIAALQRASGARVVASEPSAAEIRRGNSGPDDPQYGLLFAYPPVSNVEEFTYGEAITLGDLSLTPYSTPAHTSGGTTWTWRACEAEECLNLVYADSQTPISADGYRFTDRSDLASFEAGYTVLEELPCDILITPHPSASAFWERHDGPDGLVDPSACRRYAASARELLARRLATEQGRQ
jgi:metallo-beta-lactamase class B